MINCLNAGKALIRISDLFTRQHNQPEKKLAFIGFTFSLLQLSLSNLYYLSTISCSPVFQGADSSFHGNFWWFFLPFH